MMFPLFMTQFQQQFSNVTDEEIDQIVSKVRERLDYIENGDGAECQD